MSMRNTYIIKKNTKVTSTLNSLHPDKCVSTILKLISIYTNAPENSYDHACTLGMRFFANSLLLFSYRN